MNILFKNGTLIDPSSGREEETSIHIVEGTIKAVGKKITTTGAPEIYDMAGKVIAPGFIDMHVHLREPGYEHKETILSGCEAAANGGFTAVCCMPNTNPPIDDASVVRFIHEKARIALSGLVEVFPIAAVTRGRKGDQLSPIAELSDSGAVGFSDDGDPVHDSEIMRRSLEYSAMFAKPIIQHAQEMSLTKGGAMNEGFVATELGLPGMPGLAEEVMIARDVRLAEFTGGRYHVAHISTAIAVDLVRQAKRKGLTVTCEVTPHHFVLSDENVRSYDTNMKMNPPLRTLHDVQAMREGLRDGTIDVIASDHAPHSYDEKQVEFQVAPFGIIGLETMIGLSITNLVETGILSMGQLVEKLSSNPRRILQLPPVTIEPGQPANLTILDPKAEWVVDPARLKSRSKNSPFAGTRLVGKPVAVLNNCQLLWSSL